MNKEQILRLRPQFKLVVWETIVDWFEITEGVSFFYIRSGLRHADGQTKSPYYYEDCVVGEESEKKAIKKFNKWWDSLDTNHQHKQKKK
jgi:hypothetical protein